MSIADKVRVIYGIRRFMNKYEIPVNIEKDRYLNPIFYQFAVDMGWQNSFRKSNSNGYRGKYEPSLANAIIISANFNDFKNWMSNNYKLRQYENIHATNPPIYQLNKSKTS